MDTVAPSLPRVARVDLEGVDIETTSGMVRVSRDGQLSAPMFLDRVPLFAALARELIFGFFGETVREEIAAMKKPAPKKPAKPMPPKKPKPKPY